MGVRTTAYAVSRSDWEGYEARLRVEDPEGTVQTWKGDQLVMAREEHRQIEPAFTAAERDAMQTFGTVVPHYTYSLQQESFARAGYTLGGRPTGQTALAVLGVELVICIATENRYGIFPVEVKVRRYGTIEGWRASDDYPVGAVR